MIRFVEFLGHFRTLFSDFYDIFGLSLRFSLVMSNFTGCLEYQEDSFPLQFPEKYPFSVTYFIAKIITKKQICRT